MNHSKPDLGIAETKPAAIRPHCLVGNFADAGRQSVLKALGHDENSGLLSVTSAYWVIYCTYKIIEKLTTWKSPHITLKKMQSAEFQNAVRKYVNKAIDIYYDAAVDTYDRDEYGSFKSALRSTKFLQKMDGKIKMRVAKINAKSLPDLVAVAKSVKT